MTRSKQWATRGTAASTRKGMIFFFLSIATLLVAGCGTSNGTTPVAVLPAPVIQAVDAGDGIAALSWSPVPSAAFYTLYYDTSPDLTLAGSTAISGIDESAYVQTGLTPGETYFYVVRAVGLTGPGLTSDEVSVTLPPATIEVLEITAGDNVVIVDWEPALGAESYVVFRSLEPDIVPADALAIPVDEPPFEDETVWNGQTFYYKVCAVGSGGDSPLSLEVSAEPLAVLGAPVNVTVTLMEETINLLQISWEPPLEGDEPDSYNLYWDTVRPVDLNDEVIEGVTSPYLHTGLIGGTTYYYRVAAVSGDVVGPLSAEVSGVPRGSRGQGAPQGGHDASFGNNLSFPILFADGYGLGGLALTPDDSPWLERNTGMRPTTNDVVDPFPYFNDDDQLPEQPGWFPQQTSSTWQADWAVGPTGDGEAVHVTAAWGDNLSSVAYGSSSVIRVETLLFQDLDPAQPDEAMNAYEMKFLQGFGPTELQGTNAVTYLAPSRRVYTVHARLTIRKLLEKGGAFDPDIPPELDAAVHEKYGSDGPGGYGAEVNVGGSLVYGYVWMLRNSNLTDDQKVGWWRLTFSLDESAEVGATDVPRRTVIDGVAVGEEESEDGVDTGALITHDGDHAVSIEIYISPRRGSGGGGGGGGNQ